MLRKAAMTHNHVVRFVSVTPQHLACLRENRNKIRCIALLLQFKQVEHGVFIQSGNAWITISENTYHIFVSLIQLFPKLRDFGTIFWYPPPAWTTFYVIYLFGR